jgi:hypothetical protein
VHGVVAASVAAVSGVLVGDVILAIDGQPVGALPYDDAITVLHGAAASGQPITLSMGGGGGDGNDGPAKPLTAAKGGRNVTLSRLHREPGEGLGLQLVRTSADGCGLSVHSVVAASVAAASRVLVGDVILAIDGQPVSSLPYDDAITVVRGAAASGQPTILSMEGGGGDGDGDGRTKRLQVLPILLQTLASERYLVRNWSRKRSCCRKVDFRAIASAQHPELGRFAAWKVLPPGCSVPMSSYQPADVLAVLEERLATSEPTDTPWTIVWDVLATSEQARA